MGWLFGKKKVEPKVPFPQGKSFDEKTLQFPTRRSTERVIEPEQITAAAGLEEREEESLSPIAPPREKKEFPTPLPPGAEEVPEILFVKVDIYQRILGEIDLLRKQMMELGEISKKLETSEYNEETNFNKLRRAIKAVHDELLHIDKVLFKS